MRENSQKGTGRLARLLALLAEGAPLGAVWSKAGFVSQGEAARALEAQASRLAPGPAAEPAEECWDGKPVEELVVYTDGAARGNPGPASAAAVAYDGAGRRLASVAAALGRATNNAAEYHACLLGLRLAVRLGARRVTLRTDSQLVARQLSGEYKIRSAALRALADEVLEGARGFETCAWEHVPRAANADADRLANEVLDAEAKQA